MAGRPGKPFWVSLGRWQVKANHKGVVAMVVMVIVGGLVAVSAGMSVGLEGSVGASPDHSAEAGSAVVSDQPESPVVAPSSTAASQVPVPAATTEPGGPVPTPGSPSGALDEVEAAKVEQPVAPSVGLDVPAVLAPGVQARVSDVEAIQGEARGFGELSGPAVRFRVSVENTTDKPVSLDHVVVDVSAGASDTPALVLSGPGVEVFPPSVEPGGRASAVYVYLVPNEDRNRVRVLFNLRVDVPIAAFEGLVPASL